MRLGTARIETGTAAVRVDGDVAIEIHGVSDVGALLADTDWSAVAAAADGRRHRLSDISWATLIPNPRKIICVGLNYRNHIVEMGRDLPEYPTLFAKFPEALIGANDDIAVPPGRDVDWECELVVVIGAQARWVDENEATAAIAGYSVMNDVTMRDYQFRTREWLQGKTFEQTTPVGPVFVTTDEWQPGPTIRTLVNGRVMQEASTGDLLFTPAHLVAYLSEIITLQPGDIIATGTPGGVGHARKPPVYLAPGDRVETTIDGIGALANACVAVPVRDRNAISA